MCGKERLAKREDSGLVAGFARESRQAGGNFRRSQKLCWQGRYAQALIRSGILIFRRPYTDGVPQGENQTLRVVAKFRKEGEGRHAGHHNHEGCGQKRAAVGLQYANGPIFVVQLHWLPRNQVSLRCGSMSNHLLFAIVTHASMSLAAV
jgi:hypothetical protein